MCAALLPDEAEIERLPCSSPDHAPDLLARLLGTGAKRVLLLGHLDTVVAHQDHRPLTRDGDKLVGSGAVDMKGGDVLAIGVMRALARRPDAYAEAALLLVCDEEWRTGTLDHVHRFEGWDACLCFEGGEQTAGGEEGVVVRRKAAGTIRVTAQGPRRPLGLGARPRPQRAARARDGRPGGRRQHDPSGPAHLTSVPTILRSGEAFNVVPGRRRAVLRLPRRRARRDRGRAAPRSRARSAASRSTPS